VRVRVRFLGLFAKYVGAPEGTFDVPDGATAGDLLIAIAKEYDSALPENLFDKETGRFHRSITIARTGASAISNDEELRDGDDLFVLFPLAGG
jgi:molybdopterin converting factor small subunit